MRKMAALLSALCLLSAGPAFGAVELGWTIHLGNVPGQGLVGDLTIPDVKLITYEGMGHAHFDDANHDGFSGVGDIATADMLFYATSILDDISTSQSTMGETLNGMPGFGTTFEITFALHATAQIYAVDSFNNPSWSHLPGGTLDVYIQNTTEGGRCNPSMTSGGDGFLDGTKIASFVDMGGMPGRGCGALDIGAFNGDECVVFQPIAGSGPANVLVDSKGNDLLNLPFPDYALGILKSDFDNDADGDGSFGTAVAPANWTFSSNAIDGYTDFFFKESGALHFEAVVPEPATMVVWGLLGLCAFGFGTFRHKK